MAENSEWRLPVLSDEQKDWVINSRAAGMNFEEITSHFREIYPDYAADISDDVFQPLFTHRIKTMLNSSSSSARYFLEAKQNGEIPISLEAIPLALPYIRLLYLQRIWDETPARTLQRVVETDEGVKEVYKENTRERLAILSEVRRELEILGLGTDQDTPFGSEKEALEDVKLVEGAKLWGEDNADT